MSLTTAKAPVRENTAERGPSVVAKYSPYHDTPCAPLGAIDSARLTLEQRYLTADQYSCLRASVEKKIDGVLPSHQFSVSLD